MRKSTVLQVLQGWRPTRSQDGAEEPNKQGDEWVHGCASLLSRDTAAIYPRTGFPSTAVVVGGTQIPI